MKNEDEEIRIERVLPGPVEDVWGWLTDPAKVGSWLANDATAPGEEGGEVELELEDGRVVHGTVTTFEPPRRLAYTWDGGQVSFELLPRGEEVLLVLTDRRARMLTKAAA
jgi:uncharacterized protein YndB with AHSA1/START domain